MIPPSNSWQKEITFSVSHWYILLLYILINNGMLLAPGCCFGHGIHEIYPTWSNHGEAVIVTWKLWNWPAILHSDLGWSCAFTRCPREASEGKSTRTSIQDKRQRPLPLLLKATITAQNFAWNCSNSIVHYGEIFIFYFSFLFWFCYVSCSYQMQKIESHCCMWSMEAILAAYRSEIWLEEL